MCLRNGKLLCRQLRKEATSGGKILVLACWLCTSFWRSKIVKHGGDLHCFVFVRNFRSDRDRERLRCLFVLNHPFCDVTLVHYYNKHAHNFTETGLKMFGHLRPSLVRTTTAVASNSYGPTVVVQPTIPVPKVTPRPVIRLAKSADVYSQGLLNPRIISSLSSKSSSFLEHEQSSYFHDSVTIFRCRSTSTFSH